MLVSLCTDGCGAPEGSGGSQTQISCHGPEPQALGMTQRIDFTGQGTFACCPPAQCSLPGARCLGTRKQKMQPATWRKANSPFPAVTGMQELL